MYNVPVLATSSWRPRLSAFLAGAATAIAAWISQSTLALTDAGDSTDRIALLPVSAIPLAVSLSAGGLTAIAVQRGMPVRPLCLLGFLLLPWLPFEIPHAFLIWTGPMTLLVWVAVGAAGFSSWREPTAMWGVVKRPALAAGLAAATIFSLAAWRVAPLVPGGDEPHYLIIAQSLLYDGDLRIENNHARRDYLRYHLGDLSPHYLRRGLDGEIYSIHAPGVAAIVAPAFAVGGYRGVVLLLIALASIGSALAWHVAWLRTRSYPAAWFAWAAVTLPATSIFHSFTIYPDGLAATLVLTGAWAVLRAEGEHASGARRVVPWLLHGVALAILPWLHSRFALLAGTLGVIILLRLWTTQNRIRKSLCFLLVPALACAGWLGFFLSVYGTPDPRAPYGGEVGSGSYIADGIAGLLFDQRFGLLLYAPVLGCAFIGLGAMLFTSRARRLAFELLLVIVPYLLLVTSYRMWWAGWSAPARFAMPVLLLLAIPAAETWVAIRDAATRATALGALLFTAFASCVLVLVDHGRLAYNVRTANALWIEWLSRNADLVGALPKWALPSLDFFRDIAIWSAAFALTWAGLRWAARSRSVTAGASLSTLTATAYGIAAMVAATIAWGIGGADGTAPISAQLDVLRQLRTSTPTIALELQPPRLIRAEATPHRLRLRLDLRPEPEGATVAALPAVPAGEYRLTAHLRSPSGRLRVGIDGAEHSLWQLPLTGAAPALLIRLPVDVRAVIVQTDDQRLRGNVVVQPQSVLSPIDQPAGDYARRAARYSGFRVFFLDDRSFPEPDAFWVGGERQAAIVVQPDGPADSVNMLVRNAPVANRVRIQTGGWHADLDMLPGAERVVQVPLDVRRGGTVVTVSSASGFVPSGVDPANQDHRYLGVWIRVLEPGATM
jgi:hypothetical protein